jgi:hypothetical protein
MFSVISIFSLYAVQAPVASPNNTVVSDSIQSLQQQAAQHSGIISRDLLAVSRAKASITNMVALDAASSESTQTLSAIQWADLITISHAEVRFGLVSFLALN